MTDELTVLRLVSVKGRAPAAVAATSLGTSIDEMHALLEGFTSRELLKLTPMGYRITPSGRERCTELVAAEHGNADTAAVADIYDTFTGHNSDVKEIITDWQMRGPGQPNDHSDADYDRAVLDRLQALHATVLPLLVRIGAVAPRLTHYETRLAKAAQAVAAGQYEYVSKPTVDSYHTVWFELHEDLIGLAGLTRADEAEAGRGA